MFYSDIIPAVNAMNLYHLHNSVGCLVLEFSSEIMYVTNLLLCNCHISCLCY
jgi:hypothetical protein